LAWTNFDKTLFCLTLLSWTNGKSKE